MFVVLQRLPQPPPQHRITLVAIYLGNIVRLKLALTLVKLMALEHVNHPIIAVKLHPPAQIHMVYFVATAVRPQDSPVAQVQI